MSAPEAPRANVATLLKYMHDEKMARAEKSEPSVSIEYTDAAKGEIRAVTKVYAPLGSDLDALEVFATRVAEITSAAHTAASLRKGPDA